MRWRVIPVVLFLAVAGCGVGDGPGFGAPVTLATKGPGAAVAPGLTVPAGTALLGVPFADHDGSVRAMLLVTGDPVAAMAAAVAQAKAAGFDMRGSADVARRDRREYLTCKLLSERGDWHHASGAGDALGERVADAFGLTCEARGLAGRRHLSLTLKLNAPGEPFAAHLWIHYRAVAPSYLAKPDPKEPAAEVPAVRSPIPTPRVTRLPGPGDRIAPAYEPETYRVVDGSRLAGPAMPGSCITGAFNVVVLVTGDPGSVVDGYLGQLRRGVGEVVSDVTYRTGGAEVRRVELHGAGAGDGSIHAVSAPGQPTFLLVTRCND